MWDVEALVDWTTCLLEPKSWLGLRSDPVGMLRPNQICGSRSGLGLQFPADSRFGPTRNWLSKVSISLTSLA